MRRSTLACVWPLLASVAACGSESTVETTSGGPGGAGPGGIEPVELVDNRYFLRVDDTPVPEVQLDLDKEKALALFGDEARRILLLRLDPMPLLRNVLTLVQGACGEGWMLDQRDPGYDCADTVLGATFGPDWRSTPEFAMVRLLGTTAANADLTGTSLQDFQHLIEQNPKFIQLYYYFPPILQRALGLASTTTPFISVNDLASTLQTQLLATHPAISSFGGLLPVSLYDALHDMTPIAEELGPVGSPPYTAPGEHPGLLVPDDASFTTKSDVLLPSFRMGVVAKSNLRMVQGIALGRGAGELFLQVGDAPLTFDFNDPERLRLTGLAATPTIDMRFQIHEYPGFVEACKDSDACKHNLPPPRGTPVPGGVWSIPPPLFEPIVAAAALGTYGRRSYDECYLMLDGECLEGISIGQNGNPPGWMEFANNLQSVDVPEPEYLWELLDETAQVALHDPAATGSPVIPEGQANPMFALHGVPIGYTGDELVAQIRPTLQAQAQMISLVLLGRYWLGSDPLDFYYQRPAPGMPPYLYFVSEDDIRPSPDDPGEMMPYTYDRPGFFASPDLGSGTKLSSTVVPGIADTTHEKYLLPEGNSNLFAQDSSGRVYAIHFFVPAGDSTEITAEVTPL